MWVELLEYYVINGGISNGYIHSVSCEKVRLKDGMYSTSELVAYYAIVSRYHLTISALIDGYLKVGPFLYISFVRKGPFRTFDWCCFRVFALLIGPFCIASRARFYVYRGVMHV